VLVVIDPRDLVRHDPLYMYQYHLGLLVGANHGSIPCLYLREPMLNHVNSRYLKVEETRLARDLASALFQECRSGGHLPFCIVGPLHRPWFCCLMCLRGCSTSLAFCLYPRRYMLAVGSYCHAHGQRFPSVVRHQDPYLAFTWPILLSTMRYINLFL
jgi:hypothetical protein